MKASELKPGDHYKCVKFPTAPTWRVDTDRRVCVIQGVGTGNGRTYYPGDPADSVANAIEVNGDYPVELVPMPGPYVVGKAYRTRVGERVVFSRPGDMRWSGYPFAFTRKNNTDLCVDAAGDSGTGNDIMGEWREPEPAVKPVPTVTIGHQYNPGTGQLEPITAPATIRGKSAHILVMDDKEQTTHAGQLYPTDWKLTKESKPMKRTLPTVTLDQIFETLKEEGACWYRDLGPSRLGAKLEDLGSRIAHITVAPHVPARMESVNIRGLHDAVKHKIITASEANWLASAFGDRLITRCMYEVLIQGGTQARPDIGTPAFAKGLDEWENPKPKDPTVGDLKPGNHFMLGEDAWVVIETSKQGGIMDHGYGHVLLTRAGGPSHTCCLRLKDGFIDGLYNGAQVALTNKEA